MGRFIEVQQGKEVFSLEYSPQRLIEAPLALAEAAICQEESQYMTQHFRSQVKEDIGELLLIDVLYEKTLNEHLDHSVVGVARCTDVTAGQAFWNLELMCEDCDGSGVLTTQKGREVGCPLCGDSGVFAEVLFITDLFGRFTGWQIYPVLHKGQGGDSIYPMPLEKALERVAGWWA